MKFIVNWNLDGFRGLLHEAGAVIEADFEEVEEFVKGGVLSLPDESKIYPEPVVDFATLNDDQLIAFAKDNFGFDLDPTLAHEAMVAELEALVAGDTDSDAENMLTEPKDFFTLGTDDMTKADLIKHIAEKFKVDMSERLNKAAILAELAALEMESI